MLRILHNSSYYTSLHYSNMGKFINSCVFLSLLTLAPLCFSMENNGGPLYPSYDHSCPKLQEIVWSVVANAVSKEPTMTAFLLMLHFHDCFVKGCVASVLLDSSGSIVTEKRSNPNRNPARGFEVIDAIKAAVEKECPGTVSCADILTLAARDSTLLTGGPNRVVTLGRRDSIDASLSGSNYNIPAPNNTFQTILTKFKLKGLDIVDLVALSERGMGALVRQYRRKFGTLTQIHTKMINSYQFEIPSFTAVTRPSYVAFKYCVCDIR